MLIFREQKNVTFLTKKETAYYNMYTKIKTQTDKNTVTLSDDQELICNGFYLRRVEAFQEAEPLLAHLGFGMGEAWQQQQIAGLGTSCCL